MNESARRMIARDPIISLASLRLFKLAGITADQFLAGLQPRVWGAHIDFSTSAAQPPKVVRVINAAGYSGGSLHHSVGSRAIFLQLFHRDLVYSEGKMEMPEFYGTKHAVLTLRRQALPHTLLAGIVGRHLTDVVGSDKKLFFNSTHARILAAAREEQDGDTDLEIVLADKWMPLSRFLRQL